MVCFVHECIMCEETIHILPFESRGGRAGNAVVDGMHGYRSKNGIQYTVLRTVTGSHSFKEQLIAMIKEYGGIIVVCDTDKDSSFYSS